MTQQPKLNILTFANIDWLLMAAFMVSFFLHYRINGFMAMLVIIYGVVKLIARKISFKGGKGLLFFPILFLLLVVGQAYTTDLKEGWTIVERNLSLLLLPWAVASISRMTHYQREILIHFFIVSGVIIGIACLVNAGITSYEAGSIYVIPNDTHFIYNRFMHHRLTDPFGLHAVYYSLYIALANVFLLSRILSGGGSLKKYIGPGFIFLFFAVLLYLLKSANIVFGFALSCVLVVIYQYGKRLFESKKRLVVISMGIILLGIFAYKGVVNKMESFAFTHDMSDELLTPMQIRLSIWECTLQVISENWLLGTGTGDAHNALMEKYHENNFVIGYENDFNSHNMYLQYWMGNGIAALTVFILGLGILARKALKHKNVVFLSFVILFALFSLTESTLRTQKGMLFFVFFGALFYWWPTLWSANTEVE